MRVASFSAHVLLADGSGRFFTCSPFTRLATRDDGQVVGEWSSHFTRELNRYAVRQFSDFVSPFQGCVGSVVCVVSVIPFAVSLAVVQPVVDFVGSPT